MGEIRKKGTVRIIMPTAVGYDIKRFKECLSLVARKLGHPNCASGLPNCTYSFEGPMLRVDDKMEIHDFTSHVPSPIGTNPSVTVKVSPAALNSLATINQIVDQVVGRIGCQPCTSGFDLLFQQEVENLAFQANEQGNLV